VNGVRVQSEISSTTISHAGRLAAFECLTKSGSYQAWDYGIYAAGVQRAGYFSTAPTGSAALNSLEIAVADATTNSSGYSRGLYINATVSGTKTGSGEFNGIGIDATISGNTPYYYGLSLYSADSGDPTIGYACPIGIYQDDLGSAISVWSGMDVGVAFTNAPTSRSDFLKLMNHSTTIGLTSVFQIKSQNNNVIATYLFDFQGSPTTPIVADTGATGDNAIYKIKCRYQSTDFYLAGFADF